MEKRNLSLDYLTSQNKLSFGFKDFDKTINNIWENGERNKAIFLLIEKLNQELQNKIPLLLQLGFYFLQLNQLQNAIKIYSDIIDIDNTNLDAKNLLLICYGKAHQYKNIVTIANELLKFLPDSINLHSMLANAYGHLQQHLKAKIHGERALILSDALASEKIKFLNVHIPDYDSEIISKQLEKKSVISFSLFGHNPRYLRGALHNVLLAMELYSGWIVRFYVDSTTPAEFVTLLRDLKCEVIIEDSGQGILDKFCWRFKVCSDNSVGRFIIRDCDSVICAREVSAVKEWIGSKKLFHIIRDGYTHTSLILAGMWGGIAGVLPNILTLLDYYKTNSQKHYFHGADQEFLSHYIWNIIKQSCYINDNVFEVFNAQKICHVLTEDEERIGVNQFSANYEKQALFLKAWIDKYNCLSINVANIDSTLLNRPVFIDRDKADKIVNNL